MLRMQTGLRQSSCGSCRIAGVVLAPDYIRSRLDRLPLLVRSHWIKVVQGIEMVLNKDVYPNVYTAQPERPQKESLWKRIKNIFRCNKSKCYAPGFVSTQKITGIFIFFAALAWGGLITYILYQWCCGWNLWSIILSVLCGFLTVVLLCRLHWGKSRFYSSTIIDR